MRRKPKQQRVVALEAVLIFVIPVAFLFVQCEADKPVTLTCASGTSVAVAFAISVLGVILHFTFAKVAIPLWIRLVVFWCLQLYIAKVPVDLWSPDSEFPVLSDKAGGVMQVGRDRDGQALPAVEAAATSMRDDEVPPVKAAAISERREQPPAAIPAGKPVASVDLTKREEFMGKRVTTQGGSLSRPLKTFSVVLPCAEEGELMVKTARSVFEFTPRDVLHEIIVVDDGSRQPLEPLLPDKDALRVKFIRHQKTQGLIRTKKDGGDAATGDIVVFLDCHVKPDPNWWRTIQSQIADNYRRVVVPIITALNVDTWQEFNRPPPGAGGMSKCYLTWDIEFKWFEDDTPYVPIMSGGLLAMSRQWWNETGGYDTEMYGWGGENIDQSLRIWLCGGEIVTAPDSYVAHMWRDGSKPKTVAKYHVPPGSVYKNRQRAAKAWFDELYDKTLQFDEFKSFSGSGQSKLGPMDNFKELKSNLECKPFAWFVDRFPQIYHWGGLLPPQIFQIGTEDGSLCLTRSGGRWGNAYAPQGSIAVTKCKEDDRVSWFHGANRDGKKCCSGVRGWNSDQCLVKGWSTQISTSVCNLNGYDGSQRFVWKDGLLHIGNSANCLSIDATNKKLSTGQCSSGDPSLVRQLNGKEPMEWKKYEESKHSHENELAQLGR